MLEDDDERDQDVTGDDDGRVRRRVGKREDREERGGDDGAQRDEACEKKDDDKDAEEIKHGGEGDQGEEDSECRGDAFASAKAEPDGIAVAEDGGEGGGDSDVIALREPVGSGDMLGEDDSDEAFESDED